MYTYSTEKDFTPEQLVDLFRSVNWELDTPSAVLYTAMQRASHLVTAWDDKTLIGLIRSTDDSIWHANIDCLVVRDCYQHRGIGTALLNKMQELLESTACISVSPNDACNNRFYEKFGFVVIEGSSLLQRF